MLQLPNQPLCSANDSAARPGDGNGPERVLSRRQFVLASTSVGASLALGGCQLAPRATRGRQGEWEPADLVVERGGIEFDGRSAEAVTINGSVPGPILRFREGQEVLLRVQNRLYVDTSIHWHGLILPPSMDGVPGVSFRGIAPGETFTYRFPVRQSGTYWYHSHSGFQEQLGMFGAFLIEPAEPEPFTWDVEHVVMLSDWTFEDPMRILARLKKSSGYYNFQKPTVVQDGLAAMLSNRAMWGAMRMDPTDIADVTGATYTYLMNGKAPESNWTGLFERGQRVRLRIVNAGAATYFDVRIPGLSMTVVKADGQNVEPVTVDELRVAIAETYDVLVSPEEGRAYTVFAEAMDRSGYARGTLAPMPGMVAEIPNRRPRPLLTMKDMGMAGMPGMDMSRPAAKPKPATRSEDPMAGMHDMESMGHKADKPMSEAMPGMPGMAGESQGPAWARPVQHGPDDHGPGNTTVAQVTQGRLDEPGIGLEDAGHRVLVYTDLRRLVPGDDQREPERELEMHLTGNMERYIWGFDGKKYSEVEPIPLHHGERLRITFVNDTMMNHPIHLHGMWMELVNGAGKHKPRKHTVNVKPAERVSVDITVDAPGRWAMHCHILYHMEAGMFRVVEVSQPKAPMTELGK
jgi:CopA family copper-resistance protein